MSEKRTHPADITSARLARHYEKWFGRFSGAELVAIGGVRAALQRITDEDENPETLYGDEAE